GAGHMLDPRTAERCRDLADDVCRLWDRDDAGIREIEQRPYTTSKIACWSALHHAIELAEQGRVPDGGAKTWKQTRHAIRAWVEERCFSDARGAYLLLPGSDELDAGVLLGARFEYFEAGNERFLATIDTLRRELGAGPFLYRTSGLRGREGCFLA